MVTSEKHQKALLGGVERFCGLTHPELIPGVPKILMAYYQEDILEEEIAKNWGTHVSKKYTDKETSKKVRKAAAPFLTVSPFPPLDSLFEAIGPVADIALVFFACSGSTRLTSLTPSELACDLALCSALLPLHPSPLSLSEFLSASRHALLSHTIMYLSLMLLQKDDEPRRESELGPRMTVSSGGRKLSRKLTNVHLLPPSLSCRRLFTMAHKRASYLSAASATPV